MQSVLVYGRLLARAFSASIYSYSDVPNPNVNREVKLVTASCGFSKEVSNVTSKHGLYGDDAWFVSGYKTSDVLGVADGVGGWREYGIDPSLFSSSLMKTCERLVHHGRFNPRSPAGIIAASYNELLESKVPILGSSTACVVVLDRLEKTMYAANLGDSGYRVVREGQIVHRSEEQQHYFNTPFQLSLIPPQQTGLALSDSPDSAETLSFLVQDGDLIVVATDGLFDNMSDKMIVKELAKLRDQKIDSIQQIVNSLALKAKKLSFDPNYMSPFALHAKDNGIQAKGGKPDDITILLASVATYDSQ